jgi:ubiquinol-cytochrome c reductase iron-sulfur subunit
VRRLTRWLVAGLVLLGGRRKPTLRRVRPERVVTAGEGRPRAELAAVGAFAAAALFAVAFVVVYALDRLPAQTQLLGASLGLSFASLSAALLLIGLRVLPEEQAELEYHETAPDEQLRIERIVAESEETLTRRRLLKLAGGGAAGALGLALITPALSLGPAFDLAPFYEAPWRRGLRLVDEEGRLLRADEIAEELFYTAFPEDAPREELGSPIVVVRLAPDALALPAGRANWAPDGILAYSKICTHAGCAVSIYRTPKFAPRQPKPALVCPCHYSTFDPATGGTVEFGPAGRPLPQLPLAVDGDGYLVAGGNFSDPVGPSWWGVRTGEAT